MDDKQDVTERATAGGWTLPQGWTVTAEAYSDELLGDPVDEYGDDAYGPAVQEAWRRGDWGWVVLVVFVEDAAGRQWGRASLGGVEAGSMPIEDEDGTVLGEVFLRPLEDKPGEYSPIREHDLIGEALRDAVQQLEAFGTPVLAEPAGTTVTGL